MGVETLSLKSELGSHMSSDERPQKTESELMKIVAD